MVAFLRGGQVLGGFVLWTRRRTNLGFARNPNKTRHVLRPRGGHRIRHYVLLAKWRPHSCREAHSRATAHRRRTREDTASIPNSIPPLAAHTEALAGRGLSGFRARGYIAALSAEH